MSRQIKASELTQDDLDNASQDDPIVIIQDTDDDPVGEDQNGELAVMPTEED